MDYKFSAIFESNKNILEMKEDTDIKIIDIQGIEASSYTINTISSEQDGAIVTSEKVLSAFIFWPLKAKIAPVKGSPTIV